MTEYTYKYFADEIGFNISFKNTSYCYINTTDENYIKQVQVQERSSEFRVYGILASTTAIFGIGALNRLADAKGRLFAISLFAAIKLFTFSANATLMYNDVSPYVMLITSAIDGLGGSMIAQLGLCALIIADVLPPERRVLANVIMDLWVFIGASIGARQAGTIISNFWFPIACMAALWFAVFLYAAVILRCFIPEACSSNVPVSSEASDDTVGPISVLRKPREDNQKYTIYLLLANYALLSTCWSRGLIDDLFALNQPFCMNAAEMGLYYLISSITGSASITLLTIYQAIFPAKQSGQPALLWLYGGTILNSLRILLFIFASTKQHFYAQIALGGLVTDNMAPLMRGQLSNIVSPQEQAAISTLYGTVTVCSFLGGALTHLYVYRATVAYFPKLILMIFDLPVSLLMLSCVVWIHANRPKVQA